MLFVVFPKADRTITVLSSYCFIMFKTFKIFLLDDRDEPPNFITFKSCG
jgi:hypothetical protein